MNNTYIPFIYTGDTIALTIGGEQNSIPSTHVNFEKILNALRQQDFSIIPTLVDIPKAIETYAGGKIAVIDGLVTYNGEALHNYLTNRILDMMEEGLPITAYMNHLTKWQQNPSFRAREQGYGFCEKAEMPIAEDGDFYAYRWVTDDYLDSHSRSMSNKVGETVSMPRHLVDDDPTRTCSSGLHVCSRHYDKFSNRLMLVKVNPKNVVSVPVDYDQAKMRVCEFTIVQEIEDAKAKVWESAVYEANTDDAYDYYDDDDYNY